MYGADAKRKLIHGAGTTGFPENNETGPFFFLAHEISRMANRPVSGSIPGRVAYSNLCIKPYLRNKDVLSTCKGIPKPSVHD